MHLGLITGHTSSVIAERKLDLTRTQNITEHGLGWPNVKVSVISLLINVNFGSFKYTLLSRPSGQSSYVYLDGHNTRFKRLQLGG